MASSLAASGKLREKRLEMFRKLPGSFWKLLGSSWEALGKHLGISHSPLSW
jgi:hypothetical protein